MIYSLTAVLDDPRFDSLECDMRHFDSVPARRDSLNFEVRRLSGDWIPPEATGFIRATNHYPCINLIIPAFSLHSTKCLRNLLDRHGELLPVRNDSGEFFFYNITTIANVLDVGRADVLWSKPEVTASIIKRYAFYPAAENYPIFRIPQKPSNVFVNTEFVEQVMQHGLTGFQFTQRWPVPKDPARAVLRYPLAAPESAFGAALTVDDATRESVYLDVLSPDESQDGSDRDTESLAYDLRRMLAPKKDHAFAVGHLEYLSEEDGFERLVFSCPNSDRLADELKRIVGSMKLNEAVRVVKRLGRFDNVEAKEIEFRLSV